METKEYSEKQGYHSPLDPFTHYKKHAWVCVKTLPKVYHPKDKPWITPTEATADELKQQIERVPHWAF